MVALLPIVGGVQGPASPLRTHPWSFSSLALTTGHQHVAQAGQADAPTQAALVSGDKALRMTVKVKEGVSYKLALAMGTAIDLYKD